MKRIIGIIFLVALLVGFPGSAPAGEKEVLRAFETLKASGATSDREYDRLYRDAQVELNILKRSLATNKDFLDTAQACFNEYSFVAYSRMMAGVEGEAARRANNYQGGVAAIQLRLDAIQKSMEDAAVLLDKLYTFVK